jgi:hypothetical protein
MAAPGTTQMGSTWASIIPMLMLISGIDAGAASSHKRKREEPRPVVEDEACHAFFARLRRVCEQTCEEVLGQPYAGFNVRLFYNGSQGNGQGPHKDGPCKVEGSVRMVCHLVLPSRLRS